MVYRNVINLNFAQDFRYQHFRGVVMEALKSQLDEKQIQYVVNVIVNDFKKNKMFGNCVAGFDVGFNPIQRGAWQYSFYQNTVMVKKRWWWFSRVYYAIWYE